MIVYSPRSIIFPELEVQGMKESMKPHGIYPLDTEEW